MMLFIIVEFMLSESYESKFIEYQTNTCCNYFGSWLNFSFVKFDPTENIQSTGILTQKEMNKSKK